MQKQVARVLCDGEILYEKMREISPPIRALACLGQRDEKGSVKICQNGLENAGTRRLYKGRQHVALVQIHSDHHTVNISSHCCF
jgi:hypothetical protein